MLLSEILKQMSFSNSYELFNEKPFEYLALTASAIDHPNCVFLDSERYSATISDSVSMVLTVKELVPALANKHYGLCVVDKPRELFFELHNFLSDKKNYSRPEYKTMIGEGCSINPLSHISTNNVKIGNNVTIEEFVSIKQNVIVGDNCIIRAGTVIGGEGFEFKRSNSGILPVKHVGGVIIGNNVELQQNNCIDKAIYPWDDTEIGDYCKTDNFIHIAHACKLKRNILIASHTGIAGRVIIEDDVWIGPGVTISNGLRIGKGARVNIGSVVNRSVEDYGSVTGNFAIKHQRFMSNLKKSIEKNEV